MQQFVLLANKIKQDQALSKVSTKPILAEMASKLRKYKYTGAATTGPDASSGESTEGTPETVAANPGESASLNATLNPDGEQNVVAELKSQVLLSIKEDITSVIKAELRKALAEDFGAIKEELQSVRNEIASSREATRQEVDQVKTTVKDIENGLSFWSDEVTTIQSTVANLKKS
ncbi:hypothetical protein WMY93_001270 [Mugilogobius chulae]|uniref:Uncharacterized protein n=1 Tax=Mugilogobius chulae TaxID=88201 RepID=A0AAW0Q4W8_9GOBI